MASGKGNETAGRILDAALKLFAARGYAAVSMREIGAAVGIRPGGIYNHFPTKQAILLTLLTSHMDGLLEAWDEAAREAGPDPARRLERFARFHVRYHFNRPDAVFVSYMELRNIEPANFAAVEALRRRYEGVLCAILEDGQAAGTLTVRDPAVETRALISMLTGITTWFRDDGRLPIEAVEDLYVGLALRSVGPSREHERTAPCSTAA